MVRVEWLEGYFGTVGFQFREMNRLPADPGPAAGHGLAGALPPGAADPAPGPSASCSRGAFSRADVRWRYTKKGMPKNYVVIAKKPIPASSILQQPDDLPGS